MTRIMIGKRLVGLNGFTATNDVGPQVLQFVHVTNEYAEATDGRTLVRVKRAGDAPALNAAVRLGEDGRGTTVAGLSYPDTDVTWPKGEPIQRIWVDPVRLAKALAFIAEFVGRESVELLIRGDRTPLEIVAGGGEARILVMPMSRG